MADLAYSLASLDSAAGDLAGLADSFDASGSYVDRNADAVGHRKVVTALDGFVDNWKRHREGLSKSLRSVSDMAAGCAEGFDQTDRELATQITQAVRGSS